MNEMCACEEMFTGFSSARESEKKNLVPAEATEAHKFMYRCIFDRCNFHMAANIEISVAMLKHLNIFFPS
jgi:hypothetical protein